MDSAKEVQGSFVNLEGELFYKIANYDKMDDFFMSLTSSSDIWNFLWAKGGITAGRQNADHAIFQYGTADRIADFKYTTGSYTAVAVEKDGQRVYWEPFGRFLGTSGAAAVADSGHSYNIYKNINGSKVIFEEINEDLQLIFRYGWTSSKRFGLVKFSKLINAGKQSIKAKVLDGARNIMPALIPAFLQNDKSVLVDAYKEVDLDEASGLAMFALSSALTDRAEPNEALLTNTCWFSTSERVYLSDDVIGDFFAGRELKPVKVLKGRRGSCYICHESNLAAGGEDGWYSVFDSSLSAAKVVSLVNAIKEKPSAKALLEEDIAATDKALDRFIEEADGIQHTADQMACVHHRTNVIFNIMRGGLIADNGMIPVGDFLRFCQQRNTACFALADKLFDQEEKNQVIAKNRLAERIAAAGDAQLERLCLEYMPVIFSRRHGDPSRPWNQFNIALTDQDGSQILNYEGNWRDIFQNWEALLVTYPEYIPNVIAKFVNAMTIDGFNPYRISREGIDWECPDPSDPWAQFGYWGDHQVIYLQKLLEMLQAVDAGKLDKYLEMKLFATANVPYRLKEYEKICRNPSNSLVFDKELSDALLSMAQANGSDAKLVQGEDGQPALQSLTVKLVQIVIAKMANLVPAGGIWMNTQRPEWNDANNALAGWGLSVVTLCYLERMLKFLIPLYVQNADKEYELPVAVAECMRDLAALYERADERICESSAARKEFVDRSGHIYEQERTRLYKNYFAEGNVSVTGNELANFYALAEKLVADSIFRNKRPDGLYHTYNILHIGKDGMSVENLQEMLEGQVAVISSELLDSREVLDICTVLRNSAMYEERQNSYMLYPNKNLKTFLEKNLVLPEMAHGLEAYLEKDENGCYHFNAACQNKEKLLAWLSDQPQPDEEVKDKLLALYERVFQHHSFTGRSGTFYAYEGLGSIYWHMVAKLLLAVQEAALKSLAQNDGYGSLLKAAYEQIKQGLGGSCKSPEIYGSFPYDPYSHTPYHRGACQPGMTGQVKEEILTRWGELGISICDGCAVFNPQLLDEHELGRGSLSFSWCGVLVEYRQEAKQISLHLADGTVKEFGGNKMPQEYSRMLFARNGQITQIVVH